MTTRSLIVSEMQIFNLVVVDAVVVKSHKGHWREEKQL